MWGPKIFGPAVRNLDAVWSHHTKSVNNKASAVEKPLFLQQPILIQVKRVCLHQQLPRPRTAGSGSVGTTKDCGDGE